MFLVGWKPSARFLFVDCLRKPNIDKDRDNAARFTVGSLFSPVVNLDSGIAVLYLDRQGGATDGNLQKELGYGA